MRAPEQRAAVVPQQRGGLGGGGRGSGGGGGGDERGAALRSRVAAQADAALASGGDDRLRRLLSDPPSSKDEEREQMALAAELLLERPPRGAAAGATEDLVDPEELRRAAEVGDLKALASMDKRLRNLLDSDDQMQLLNEGDLSDPHAREALRLYRDSFMALERQGGGGGAASIEREAFQAVARDDVATLQALLERGLSANTKNAGGQSLAQLAMERGSAECARALASSGAGTAGATELAPGGRP